MDIARTIGLSPNILAEALDLARSDDAFLDALKTDASSAISERFGETPNAGLKVNEEDGAVLVQLDDKTIFTWNDDGELDDSELEMVAGGARTKLPD